MNPFTKHPHQVGETYWQHMKAALTIAQLAVVIVWVSLIHSVFPFWYTTAASRKISELVIRQNQRSYNTNTGEQRGP